MKNAPGDLAQAANEAAAEEISTKSVDNAKDRVSEFLKGRAAYLNATNVMGSAALQGRVGDLEKQLANLEKSLQTTNSKIAVSERELANLTRGF